MFRRVSLSLLLIISFQRLFAETLDDVLKRELPTASTPPVDTQLPITSYAVLDDSQHFGIAYYLVNRSDPERLNPPLRILIFDKQPKRWSHREFDDIQTNMRGFNSSCTGSVMTLTRMTRWLIVTTHLTPSAGCTAVLGPDLSLKRTLYGWPIAWFSSGRMIIQRSEVHFASTHPLELELYDATTEKEEALLPQKDDAIRNQLVKDIRAATDPDWCRVNNANCDPERMEGSLSSVKLNDTTQAAAFEVIYSSHGYGAKAEHLVGEVEVIYVFAFANGRLRHCEFLPDVLEKAFGTVDLEKLLEPAGLKFVFSNKH